MAVRGGWRREGEVETLKTRAVTGRAHYSEPDTLPGRCLVRLRARVARGASTANPPRVNGVSERLGRAERRRVLVSLGFHQPEFVAELRRNRARCLPRARPTRPSRPLRATSRARWSLPIALHALDGSPCHIQHTHAADAPREEEIDQAGIPPAYVNDSRMRRQARRFDQLKRERGGRVNCIPLLIYAIGIARRGTAHAEIADESADRTRLFRKVRRQSLLVLFSLVVLLAAVLQEWQFRSPT
jgi:hypothetical protein